MRWFVGKDGSKRLFFEATEIEEIMEGELTQAKLLPSVGDGHIDIEAFVEFHLKVSIDQYAPLPADVLGVTHFRSGQMPCVQINEDLTKTALDDEDRPDWLVGRWRATLAHEASHVILHARLFNTDRNQANLFELDADQSDEHRLHRCLKRNVLFRGQTSDWREVQANMGMAALLMPRRLFAEICQQVIEHHGWVGDVLVDTSRHWTLSRTLAERFQVSRQAADIRMETLQLLSRREREKLF